MKGTIRLFTVLAAILAMSVAAFGQAAPGASRVVPAGTVNDQGSSLLYIADTGINLRASGENSGTIGNSNVADIRFGGAAPGEGETLTNFISITNTHPTKAVTIHFRYFNDECTDVLDFLVVLTCSDTLLFDPFNFEIPGAVLDGNPVNTRSRIFGPDVSDAFQAIPGNQFDSGRFIIFGTAAGTIRQEGNESSGNGGFDDGEFDAEADQVNILFPRELSASDCNFWENGDFAPDGTANVGKSPGFSPDNLHVFNAAAISFNHLVGHHTIAVPKAFIPDAGDNDAFLAVAVNAWTRPAVDASGVFEEIDGPALNDYLLLAGDEDVWDSTTRCQLSGSGTPAGGGSCDSAGDSSNDYYLRAELHGGSLVSPTRAENGALAWTSFHGLQDPPNGTGLENQQVDFMSIWDDYNGNEQFNSFTLGGITTFDRAYNLHGAETTYIVQLFDNNEDQLTLTGEEPIIISPPPEVPVLADMRIEVDCLRVWANNGAVALDGALRVRDLAQPGIPEVTDGGPGWPDDFDGLLAAVNPLKDASQGWVRFVRDNNSNATNDAGRNDDFTRTSFVTIGQVVLKFEGFGGSWWLPASSYDLAISNADRADPTPVTTEAAGVPQP